eukprot:350683-Chlamydomonas_euryale.AAC.4
MGLVRLVDACSNKQQTMGHDNAIRRWSWRNMSSDRAGPVHSWCSAGSAKDCCDAMCYLRQAAGGSKRSKVVCLLRTA